MSVNRHGRRTTGTARADVPTDASRKRRDDLHEAADRIDEAEDELKHDVAEVQETTEEAGYRTTGPLHEE